MPVPRPPGATPHFSQICVQELGGLCGARIHPDRIFRSEILPGLKHKSASFLHNRSLVKESWSIQTTPVIKNLFHSPIFYKQIGKIWALFGQIDSQKARRGQRSSSSIDTVPACFCISSEPQRLVLFSRVRKCYNADATV